MPKPYRGFIKKRRYNLQVALVNFLYFFGRHGLFLSLSVILGIEIFLKLSSGLSSTKCECYFGNPVIQSIFRKYYIDFI